MNKTCSWSRLVSLHVFALKEFLGVGVHVFFSVEMDGLPGLFVELYRV